MILKTQQYISLNMIINQTNVKDVGRKFKISRDVFF